MKHLLALLAAALLLATACQTDRAERDFLIAPDEVWSLERDGWQGLKLDEKTKAEVRLYWGPATQLHYRYRDSSFWMSDEGIRLQDIMYILEKKRATSGTQSVHNPLESRHFTGFYESTLNKDIDVIYVCLPDRSNDTQRASSGLNDLGLSPDDEFNMYAEFAAAVDNWNTSMEDHTRVIFVLKEFYSTSFQPATAIRFGNPSLPNALGSV